MSKLERLIQQYCPDGVEWKPLGEVCDSLNKGTLTTSKLVKSNGHNYPVINSGRELYGYYSKYNNEGDALTIAARGEYAGFVSYFSERFWAGGLCYPYRANTPTVSTKYLYYYLKSKQEYIRHCLVAEGGIPALNKSIIEMFEIPVPPLPVQEEIVRILDTFTELQAELQKRQQQYNFYRDILLSNMGNNAEYLTISEFAELKAGKAIKATELSSIIDDNHSHPCFGGNGIRGFIDKVSHIGDYAIIGRQGALCGCVNWASGKFYATEHAVVCTPRPNVSSRYLYHLFTVADLNQYKSQGAQPGLSVQRLNELVFPIPPLEEQNRIVAILDRFDTLTNDLTSGLPAEMEKRRQQYEYYRDRLLTFKRKEA